MKIWISNYKKVKKFNKKHTVSRVLYTKFLAQPLANHIIAFLINKSITPNTITTISLFFGILMALSIIFIQNYYGILLGAIFYHFRLTFDCVDGTVARLKSITSEKGAWWDELVGKISTLLLLGSLIYRIYPEKFLLGLIVFFLFVYSSHRLITGTKNKFPTKKILDKHNSIFANVYFEISRYHIYAVPFLLINRPLWVIYGFGFIECIWIVKTIICTIGDFLKNKKNDVR